MQKTVRWEKPEKILEKYFTLNYHFHVAFFLLLRHMQKHLQAAKWKKLNFLRSPKCWWREKKCKVFCSFFPFCSRQATMSVRGKRIWRLITCTSEVDGFDGRKKKKIPSIRLYCATNKFSSPMMEKLRDRKELLIIPLCNAIIFQVTLSPFRIDMDLKTHLKNARTCIFVPSAKSFLSRCHCTIFWQHNSAVSNAIVHLWLKIVRTFQLPIWADSAVIYNILVMKARSGRALRIQFLLQCLFISLHSSNFSSPNLDEFLWFNFNYVEKRLVEICRGWSPYTPCEVNPHRNVHVTVTSSYALQQANEQNKLCWSAYQWSNEQHRPSLKKFLSRCHFFLSLSSWSFSSWTWI